MSNSNAAPFGVILVNLGTPSSPDADGVRRYLAEFLSDTRVIQIPKPIWWCILHGIILRVRPARVAKLYASVWTDAGSPLLAFSRRIQAGIANELNKMSGTDIPVELAMTYGEPSMRAAGRALAQKKCRRIIVLPLYPQYSATTTAAAFDRLARDLKPCPDLPELIFIRDYWSDAAYLDALASSVREHWAEHGQGDRLLMSFHGIPKRYEDQGDPYPAECRAHAAALADRLGLETDQWIASFQSRFGKAEWVKPYTSDQLERWGKDSDIKSVDVICPAFAADCLETLEEIKEENREIYQAAGGKNYRYISCLNDRPDHVRALAGVILRRSRAWE